MARDHEIIQLNIGQAGLQIASACWELYCIEHYVRPDGTLLVPLSENRLNPFFSRTSHGRCTARAVLIDTEPSVIDVFKSSCYSSLFHPNSFIHGKEDAASNFAHGYNLGNGLVDLILEQIRKIVENCSNLQGFLTFRSLGGGTGSGLGTLIMEKLSDLYPKISKIGYQVFPSPRLSSVIVEPYNALLASHFGMDYTDCCLLLDNEALYDICGRLLNVQQPNYISINRIIGQVVSCCTSSLRYDGPQNTDMLECLTNLIPYPRIHFPVISYAPFMQCTVNSPLDTLTADQLTNDCFNPRNSLVKCDYSRGKYLACCMLYRGNVYPNDVNKAIANIRASSIPFVNWNPGFKISINSQPPTWLRHYGLIQSNAACCMLANTTAIRSSWQRLISQYKKLYLRRAFFHHYISEGMEESVFSDALENMRALVKDYQEVE